MEHHMEISKAKGELFTELERFPSIKEIAIKINKTEEHVTTYLGVKSDSFSLDTSFGEDGEEGSGYHLFESHTYPVNPEAIINRVALEEAIKTLPEKQRLYIYLKYYKHMNNEQISKSLHLNSVENVPRIGTEINFKLKRYFLGVSEKSYQSIDTKLNDQSKRSLLKCIFGEQEEIEKYIDKIDDSIETLKDKHKKYIIKVFVQGISKSDAMRQLDTSIKEPRLFEKLRSHLCAINKSPRTLILEDLKIEDNAEIDVEKIIHSLDQNEQDIIHKKYYEGKSYLEITDEMRITRHTYYKLHKQCLKSVKQRLTG